MPALTDTASAPVESPYIDDTAAPHGRRLKPVVVDAVLQGLRAGVPQHILGRTYGLQKDTICRLAKRLDTQFEEDAAVLAELAALEDDLERLDLAPGKLALLVQAVRVGHLMRAERVRRARQQGTRES